MCIADLFSSFCRKFVHSLTIAARKIAIISVVWDFCKTSTKMHLKCATFISITLDLARKHTNRRLRALQVQFGIWYGSQKRPTIPLEEISSQSDPSGGKLGPSIARMLLNLSLETAPWLQTSWLGPGTHLLNSILWPQ